MIRVWVKGAALALALAVAFGATATTAATAQSMAPPLEAYSASPAVEFIKLSPSGDLVARVTVVGERRAIIVTRLATDEHISAAPVGDAKVRDLRWVGEDHLLIVTSQTGPIPGLSFVPRSELFFGLILNVASREIVQALDGNRGVVPILFGGATVRTTPAGPALFVRAPSAELDRSVDLYRVDLDSGRGRVAVEMDYDIVDQVLDGDGRVIALAHYEERTQRWALMAPDGGSRFRDIWSTHAPLDAPNLIGLGRTPRTVVVQLDRTDLDASGGDPTSALDLIEVNVDTGEWVHLPFRRAPDALLHHPATGLLIGGGRMDEAGMRYEFIDETAGRRWAAVERAFAGKAPRIVSWSDDQRQVVVFTDIGESGLYQLVDFDRGVADILAESFPAIPADQVGAVRSIRYGAADGLEIHGYLTLPPGSTDPTRLPLVVLAHGGPAARDVIGFDWWAQALASRGYAVLQANFRGSTGYGLAFMEAGYGEWGRKMQTDLSDGVRWLGAQGLIDPERVCIVGASYGGYAAMAGITLDPGVYRCAASINGVSDLRRMVNEEANQRGRRNSQAVRYWNRFMGAERLNDRGLDALSPAHRADQAQAPLLLIHGRDDTVVPIEQSRVMAAAMRRAEKPVEFIELAGEDHWLSRTETRARMLAEVVQFVEAHNPPD